MSIGKRAAELFGTFWRVFGGCGSAVLAASFPAGEPGARHLGIGFLGVAFAFGLTLLTMAFTIGGISGCHINPAVSIGLWVGKRFPASDLLPYIIAQVAGAIAASGVLYKIASGREGFSMAAGFASNGYGAHSPGGYSLLACLVAEVVLTMFFLLIILRGHSDRIGTHADSFDLHSSDEHVSQSARNTGPALFVGGWALSQRWLFWGGTHRRGGDLRHHLQFAVCEGMNP